MRSLARRFREVDQIPTPFDLREAHSPESPAGLGVRRSARWFLVPAFGAAIAVVAVSVVALSTSPDVSWLTSATESCREEYSVAALEGRQWAFEGVIVGVQGAVDPESNDPRELTTSITFDIEKWYWGGSGGKRTVKVYALGSSAGRVENSVGARLLASGEEGFLWTCGFTRVASPQAETKFAKAATQRRQ